MENDPMSGSVSLDPLALDDDLRPLIAQCVGGCQHSMLSLVRRFQGRVLGLCYRMLGHWDDAEDATQETFVRVLKNLSRWDPSREFEPWLLTIAGNRCRTALVNRKHRQQQQEPLEFHEPPAAVGDREAQELSEEIQLSLGAMREEYRQAFVLFHECEKSYGEIAEIMQVPLGTVKTWVHRARKELIQAMQARHMLEVRNHAMP
jgi:RNA polymerase sigma-70 factor, ECF subfamily